MRLRAAPYRSQITSKKQLGVLRITQCSGRPHTIMQAASHPLAAPPGGAAGPSGVMDVTAVFAESDDEDDHPAARLPTFQASRGESHLWSGRESSWQTAACKNTPCRAHSAGQSHLSRGQRADPHVGDVCVRRRLRQCTRVQGALAAHFVRLSAESTWQEREAWTASCPCLRPPSLSDRPLS